MNDNEPAEVFSLAEHLYDEMVARGWKTEDAAIRMGSAKGAARDLLYLDILMCVPDEKLLIGDDAFDDLGRAFDMSSEYFKALHAQWLKYPERRSRFEVPDEIFGPTSRRAMIRPVST